MKALIEFTDHAYGRLLESCKSVTEEELHWNPVPEMNTTGKIMRHVVRIGLVLLPQVIDGTTSGYWDDDYEKLEHSIPDMLLDIEEGRRKTIDGLNSLNEADLDTIIPLWGGRRRRAEGINMLVGELLYHTGQIALFRGAYNRAHSG